MFQLPFCLYAWLATVLSVILALLAVTLIPGQSRREAAASFCSRLPFILTGCRPTISGIEHLPDAQCVVVANHASYVDGPLMKGYLPPRFSFVIKGEMRNIPVVHFLLRRSGSRFVERFRTHEGSRDARQIVKAAQGGASLTFFPEGTFRLEPGVGQFRAGAFLAASKGQVPVVPVVISGTREMLACDDWMLRFSRIHIQILAPITAADPAYADHRKLAEAARQAILAELDEPDLLDTAPVTAQ